MARLRLNTNKKWCVLNWALNQWFIFLNQCHWHDFIAYFLCFQPNQIFLFFSMFIAIKEELNMVYFPRMMTGNFSVTTIQKFYPFNFVPIDRKTDYFAVDCVKNSLKFEFSVQSTAKLSVFLPIIRSNILYRVKCIPGHLISNRSTSTIFA